MDNKQTEENRKELAQNNYVDPRTIDAQVIGELRKDKIGKPMLVLKMFVVFAIILIALPIVTNMLNDDTSALYKFIYGSNSIVSPIPTQKKEFLDGSVEQIIASSTKMKKDNLVISNFSISGNEINCKMYSYNGIINLDLEPFYLEIYSNSKALLDTIKLTGTLDYQQQDFVISSKKININKKYNYYAKIVYMEDKDYPKVTITSDESGIGSLTCTKEDKKIEYTFKNGYLIGINDYEKIKFAGIESDEYLSLKRKYDSKSATLSAVSSVQEVSDGFIFTANIDLENYVIPDSIVDYNYYKLDTEAKVVSYTQIGKGFDCK